MAPRVKRVGITVRNALKKAEAEGRRVELMQADVRDLLAILDDREAMRGESPDLNERLLEIYGPIFDGLDELGFDGSDVRETLCMGLTIRAAQDWAEDDWRAGTVQIDVRPDGLIRWRREFTDRGQRYGTDRKNGLGLASLFKAVAREMTNG